MWKSIFSLWAVFIVHIQSFYPSVFEPQKQRWQWPNNVGSWWSWRSWPSHGTHSSDAVTVTLEEAAQEWTSFSKDLPFAKETFLFPALF